MFFATNIYLCCTMIVIEHRNLTTHEEKKIVFLSEAQSVINLKPKNLKQKRACRSDETPPLPRRCSVRVASYYRQQWTKKNC